MAKTGTPRFACPRPSSSALMRSPQVKTYCPRSGYWKMAGWELNTEAGCGGHAPSPGTHHRLGPAGLSLGNRDSQPPTHPPVSPEPKGRRVAPASTASLHPRDTPLRQPLRLCVVTENMTPHLSSAPGSPEAFTSVNAASPRAPRQAEVEPLSQTTAEAHSGRTRPTWSGCRLRTSIPKAQARVTS